MKLVWILFLCCWQLKAQEVLISANSEASSKNMYSKVLGENNFGLYILHFKNYDLSGSFTISQYASNLNLKFKQDYKLDKGEKVLRFIVKDSFIVCITKSRKKVMQFVIDPNLQAITPDYTEIDLQNLNIEQDLIVKYSLSRNFVSIAIPIINKQSKLEVIIINRSLSNNKIELKKTIKTDHNWRDCELVDLAVNDIGGYSLIFKKPKNTFNEVAFVYFWYTEKSEIPEEINEDNFIKSVKTIYHPTTKIPYIFGLFGKDDMNVSYGIFNKKIGEPIFRSNFKQETLQATEGTKLADGIQSLFIREIVANETNTFTIVLEKYWINKQIETFMSNGIQQATTKNTYNYDDIVVVQFSDNDLYKWETVIQKKQISLGSNNYYCSFVMLAGDNSLYFILNELLSTDNRVLMYQVNKLGDKSLKELIQANSNNALAVPVEAKQVSANSLVFPFVGNRTQNLVRVNVP